MEPFFYDESIMKPFMFLLSRFQFRYFQLILLCPYFSQILLLTLAEVIIEDLSKSAAYSSALQ